MNQATQWFREHPTESTWIGLGFLIAGILVIALHRYILDWMKDRRNAVQFAESFLANERSI